MIPINQQNKKDCARCRWEQSIERQNVRIIGYVVNIIVTGFGAGLTAGLTLARYWRRQKDMERRTTCNDI